MIAIYDIEVYPNYFEVGFEFDDGSVKQFNSFGKNSYLDKKTIKKIKKIVNTHTLVGFNNLAYDNPMLALMCEGVTAEVMYYATKHLIEDDVSKWKAHDALKVDVLVENTIDLIDVARGKASLKLYMARLNAKKLQDLPYDPQTKLTKKQAKKVSKYNVNDLRGTRLLYNNLQTDLKLRRDIGEKYGIDVMSLNGAKVAESILLEETKFKGKVPKQPVYINYTPPKYIKFKTPELKAILKKIKSHNFLIMNRKILAQVEEFGNGEYTFLLDDLGIEKSPKRRYGKKSKKTISDSGSVISPDFLDKPIVIDGIEHKLGLGGVHGSVLSKSIYPEDDEIIVDIDYKSLYPSMKIVNKFYPEHIGEEYIEVYSNMYHTRNNVLKPQLKKLKKGTKEYDDVYSEQDIMKLVLNSSFGKEGEKYSKLYTPKSLIHTTLTGQLTLMMVIEKLHLKGFSVFYANTDGITLKVKKKDLPVVQKITQDFDKITGLEMEYNYFRSSHIRDVNNFVNVDLNAEIEDDVKSKGTYGEPTIEKNSEYPIVFKAIRLFLLNGTPMSKTIRDCTDIAQFCTSRQVTGGAIYSEDSIPNTEEYNIYLEERKNGRKQNKALEKRNENFQKEIVLESNEITYLGKVVRWYYATNGSPIYYKKSGNKVPKSDGAYPMMKLSKKMPKNLDYAKYDELCMEHLKDLGWVKDR